MLLIDADQIVTVNLYDEQIEEYITKQMTIKEMIIAYTEEGIVKEEYK